MTMYKCPKCGSSDTSKERLQGWDTGDRICANCGCTTAAVDFRKAAESAETDQPKVQA
ncbi:Eag protein [Halospina sp. K52047b]|nr:Eag protein [Halospina sp. K52047b]